MSNEIIEKAKKRFKRDQRLWSNIYDKSAEDLHFLSDDEFAQWDKADFEERTKTGRPALTVDQLGQFVHQVANDIRMNTPTINVLPSDVNATKDTAEILKGIIREIEYHSNADDVYDTASLNSVKCSIGFIRVDHEYVDGSLEQQLLIKRVVNPLSCWIDFDSIECDGRDAKHATIIDRMTVEAFKAKYPDFEPSCFESDKLTGFKDDEEITIAEHFVIEETPEVITSQDGLTSREINKKTVRRYKLSGKDVLEETTFPGTYIPVIPVYGEEAWINGERHIFSLIRKSKSAQRMFNYWKSLETELLMKAPQAPVMAAEGQVEDYAEDWKHPSKAMVLRYKAKDLDGNVLGAPQRLEPPVIPTGIVNAARQTVDDIKATMGIYNASLGMRSNEQSGIAIRQRQAEGDVATYHFADNLVRSITQVGRILVGAIPAIYDTPRILRIIGAEDETKSIGVNGALALDQTQTVDLTQGKYDVRVTTGASFATRRQEAAEFLTTMMHAQPELLKLAGDLLFKNMDFTGSDALSERMKKIMDPKLLEEGGQDPAVAQLTMQLQQMQQAMQAMQAELQSKNAEMQLKAQAEQNDVMESQANAQLKLHELDLKHKETLATLEIKRQELALKAQELNLKLTEMQARAMQPSVPVNAFTQGV